MQKHLVHPVFINETANGFANGGWDDELEGFWVAKFLTSMENELGQNIDTSSTTIGNAELSSTVKAVSKPEKRLWGYINIANMYANSYAYDRGVESHLIKNSEWGAVAYLTHSRYGRNGTEVTINNNSTYMTGYGGNTVSAASVDNTGIAANQYKGQYGKLASTTGNIYGVYDMSGGAYEYTAAYNKAYPQTGGAYGGVGGNSNASYKPVSGSHYAYTIYGSSTKYATAYNNSVDINTISAFADFTSDGKDVSHMGDGIHEIWIGSSRGWFTDNVYCASSTAPMYYHGGRDASGTGAGVFSTLSSSRNRWLC